MKVLILVLLIVAVILAFKYLPSLFGQGKGQCPSGESYVRPIEGGGWAPTDANDPWGQCVSETTIQQSYNQ